MTTAITDKMVQYSELEAPKGVDMPIQDRIKSIFANSLQAAKEIAKIGGQKAIFIDRARGYIYKVVNTSDGVNIGCRIGCLRLSDVIEYKDTHTPKAIVNFDDDQSLGTFVDTLSSSVLGHPKDILNISISINGKQHINPGQGSLFINLGNQILTMNSGEGLYENSLSADGLQLVENIIQSIGGTIELQKRQGDLGRSITSTLRGPQDVRWKG